MPFIFNEPPDKQREMRFKRLAVRFVKRSENARTTFLNKAAGGGFLMGCPRVDEVNRGGWQYWKLYSRREFLQRSRQDFKDQPR